MAAEQSRQHEEVFAQSNWRVEQKTRRYDLVTVAEIKALTPIVSLYLDVRPEEPQMDKAQVKMSALRVSSRERNGTLPTVWHTARSPDGHRRAGD